MPWTAFQVQYGLNRLCLPEDFPHIALYLMRKKHTPKYFSNELLENNPGLNWRLPACNICCVYSWCYWRNPYYVPVFPYRILVLNVQIFLKIFEVLKFFFAKFLFLRERSSQTPVVVRAESAGASTPSGVLSSIASWMDKGEVGTEQRINAPSRVFHSWGMWFPTLHPLTLTPRRKKAIPLGRVLPKALTQFNFTTLSLKTKETFFS